MIYSDYEIYYTIYNDYEIYYTINLLHLHDNYVILQDVAIMHQLPNKSTLIYSTNYLTLSNNTNSNPNPNYLTTLILSLTRTI